MGTSNITASIGGVTSPVDVLTVTQASSAVTLSTSGAIVLPGQPVTLTATVIGFSPTGTVQFMDGATSLGSAALAGSTAQLATSTLAAGTHLITALYSGDTNNTGSTSAAIIQTVASTPTSVTIPLTFNPGTNVSAIAMLNCPSNTTPCTDPQAHSFKLEIGTVVAPFTVNVTATEVSLTNADGICESGNPGDTTDSDCQLAGTFAMGTTSAGGIIVPQCIPYSNGNCVIYSFSSLPPAGSFLGPVQQTIAWNNSAYAPSSIYEADNPRLYANPNTQFMSDITDYFSMAAGEVADPVIVGNTQGFPNAYVVAYPPVLPVPPYTVTFNSPSGTPSFGEGNPLSVSFTLMQGGTPITNATTSPNAVSIGVLSSSGLWMPALAPDGTEATFANNGGGNYSLALATDVYPPDTYTLYLSSDLFLQQSAIFVTTAVPLQAVSTTLPPELVGANAIAPVTVTGGAAPYTFALTSGSLPPGITLGTDGVLSGTPTQAGSYPITLMATDSTSATVSISLTDTVDASIGGGVTGLGGGDVVTLLNNGGDSLTVSANGSFTFPTPLLSGASYVVTVSSQPVNETCMVTGGSGTVALSNVTNVSVVCAPYTYTIGFTVSGLISPASVTVLDNGGDAQTVSSNGSFTFPTPLLSGASYAVTVGTQPAGENCTVTGGSGTVGLTNVTGIVVACSPSGATHFVVTAPSTATAGTSFSFTVTAEDALNNVVTGYTGSVRLSSSDAGATLLGVYTFLSSDGGMHAFTATLITAGSETITATDTASFALTGTSNVITVSAGLQSVTIAAAQSSVAAGLTDTFTATGHFSDGSTQTLTTGVMWSSSNAGAATIAGSGTGTALGVAAGTATITATSGRFSSNSVTLTVTAAVLQTIAVTPGAPSIIQGQTLQFTSTGTYSDGTTQNLTGSATWTSGTTSVATIALGGLATSVSVGTTNITASVGTITSPTVVLTVLSLPVTVAPTTITTFSADVGTTSTYSTVTITNSSTTAALTITALQFNGDFIASATTCGATSSTPPPYTLAIGGSCIVTIQFDPILGGTRTGQLQIVDNAVTSPQVVNLSGIGTNPLTVSPTFLSYTAQLVGTTSPSQTVTLTNHESQSETFTLTPAGDYTASSNCPTGVIAAKSFCLIYVDFAPSSVLPSATRTGSVTIANSAPGETALAVSLTGSATLTNPAAAVAVVSPGAGAGGTSVNAKITGNGWTHFSSSSVISFTDTNNSSIASDISVSNVTVPSVNEIDATLTLVGPPSAVYGARDIEVDTPLSGGGTEKATLSSAFIIADPSNAHSIVSVTPPFGTQGQSLSVSLAAAGTNFVQGTTFANFGDGITVDSLTILDSTDAVANITISNTTPVGYRTITLVTGGEFATSVLSSSGNPIFQIGPNNATLVGFTPNTSGQNENLEVTMTAAGTHFLQDATQVQFTGGIITGNVQVTSPTTATVDLAVPVNATVGLQNATVSTGGEIAPLGNAFTVVSTSPYLSSVTPGSGQQGQANLNVEIKGVNTNFSSTAPASMLADFTGEITVNTITVISPTDVIVNISIHQDANAGGITAHLTSFDSSGNATIFPFAFTVTPSGAQITSVTPNNVPQGGQVALSVVGLNTHWDQATTTAAFLPYPVGSIAVNEITIADATHATLNISVSTNHPVGTHPFYMATGGEVVSSSISVYANTPSLTMSPANGLVGTSLSASFTGQFTHFSQTSTVPVISGEGVTLTNFTVNSPVSATATVKIDPSAPSTPTTATRLVTFTTGTEIVTTNFNVTTTPVGLISISPYHGPQSDTLNVEIVGLNTHFTQGTTQVLFGPQITVNSVTVNASTDLTANITTSYSDGSVSTATPPGWQTVYVNTGTEQVLGGFEVDAPASPTLVSVVPSSAAQGSTLGVTITGNLTNWVGGFPAPGATEAILGAGVTVSNLNVTSPTTATATIAVSPTAPVGGNSVIMITGSEIVSGTGFSVTPGAAEIVSVTPVCLGNVVTNGVNYCGGTGSGSPWVVSQLQTSSLNIVGAGTHWLQGETTMSFGSGVVVDSLTVNSPTTANVQITVLSSAPVGFAALTANTDGEVAQLQQAIDIESGFPTLLAITPTTGIQNATLTLQVLGRFTGWQQGVTSLAFNNNDVVVNSVNVIDSNNLTANITVSPWAYVDHAFPCGHVLTVTTGTQQVSTAPILDNFCVAQGAAQINSISSLSGYQGSTQTVTITGSATHFLQGVTSVSFDDPNFQVGQISVVNDTTLTAPIAISTSATPGFKTVTVTTYGEVATQQYSFTVYPDVPTLTEAIPNQAEQGIQNLDVHLVGQYSHWSSMSTATFGAGITVNSVTWTDATDLTANISIDPLSYTGTRKVTVTTPAVDCGFLVETNFPCPGGATTGSGNEIDSLNAFTIIPGPAIITNISPATGNEGQEKIVQITGSATHWAQNFTHFYIDGGGSDLTINSAVINSATSATIDLSLSPTANPGARSIYMVTNGESLADSGAFVVTGGVPVVTYLSPNSGQPGANQEQVVINGVYTQWTQATTTVSFGPGVTVTAYQVDDFTHITALINIDPAAHLRLPHSGRANGDAGSYEQLPGATASASADALHLVRIAVGRAPRPDVYHHVPRSEHALGSESNHRHAADGLEQQHHAEYFPGHQPNHGYRQRNDRPHGDGLKQRHYPHHRHRGGQRAIQCCSGAAELEHRRSRHGDAGRTRPEDQYSRSLHEL